MSILTESILNMTEVQHESEMNVYGSMLNAYDKAIQINEYYTGNDLSSFAIFTDYENNTIIQEGKIMDDVKKEQTGKSTLNKIFLFIPRLIQSVIKYITGQLDSNNHIINSDKLSKNEISKLINKHNALKCTTGAVIIFSAYHLNKKHKENNKDDNKQEIAVIDKDGNVKVIKPRIANITKKYLIETNEKLKTIIAKAKTVKQNDENKIKELQNEITKLNNTIEENNKKINETSKLYEETYSKLTSTAQDYAKLFENKESIAEERNNLSNENDELKKAKDALEKEIKSLKNQLNVNNHTNQVHIGGSKSNDEVDKLKKQLSDFENRYKKLLQTYRLDQAHSHFELKKLNDELNELREKLPNQNKQALKNIGGLTSQLENFIKTKESENTTTETEPKPEETKVDETGSTETEPKTEEKVDVNTEPKTEEKTETKNDETQSTEIADKLMQNIQSSDAIDLVSPSEYKKNCADIKNLAEETETCIKMIGESSILQQNQNENDMTVLHIPNNNTNKANTNKANTKNNTKTNTKANTKSNAKKSNNQPIADGMNNVLVNLGTAFKHIGKIVKL